MNIEWNIWNIFRHNGEWVGTVHATNSQDALRLAWNRYFGCPAGTLEPRDDGTLTVVMK